MSGIFRLSVLKAIEEDWPIHTKQLVSALGLEVNNSNVKKVSYHVQQLEKEGKVRTKRIGLALTAWPMEMEKLRVIHEMIREEK
jgi:predicted transcriptional regulator